jgi:hypothetical protein
MKRASILLAFFTFLVVGCQNNRNSNNQTTSNVAPDVDRGPGGLIVVDDIAPNYRSVPLIVDTAAMDTSNTIIWQPTGSSIATIRPAVGTGRYTVTTQNGTVYNVNLADRLDTLKLRTTALYYSMPALMGTDTVQILMPRNLLLTAGGGGIPK